MDKTRNIELDIIKGICIISIVFNHLGHNIMWFNYFMVIGFYFVAGYTFKEKSTLTFIKDKILRIYIPFVLANITVLILLKFLSGVIHPSYRTGNFDILYNLKHYIAFDMTNVIMAPSWFMLPLFAILIIFHFLKKLFKNDVLILGITFVIFVFSHVFFDKLNDYIWNNCSYLTNIGMGLFICAGGYYLKNNKDLENKIFNGRVSIECFIASMIILFNMPGKFGHAWRNGYCNSKIWNFIIVFVAIYFLVYLAKLMAKSDFLGRIVAFIGRYSMQVMFFHLIAGAIVTIPVHFIFDRPFPATWHRLYMGGKLGFITAIVGIAIPVVLAFLYDRVKNKIKK